MASEYDRLLQLASQNMRVPLTRHTNVKAKGPCPKCQGTDRLVVWLFEGTAWCSRCKNTFEFMEVSDEQRKQARVNKAKEQHDARLSMAGCTDWQDYNSIMEEPDMRVLWHSQGITDEDIHKWGLGFCPSCPTASDYASLTLPVWYERRLVDIRHKLLDVPEELRPEVGKYRSHRAKLLPHPYNLDALHQFDEIVVVEGEKKPIILARLGLPNIVGIPGVGIVDDFLAQVAEMKQGQRLTLLLDPGQDERSRELAKQCMLLGVETRVADPFIKPDDMGLRHGIDVVRSVIRQSRRIRM